jgi:ABC-2 type transport system permease protein
VIAMRVILALVRKEIIQVLRDRNMLRMIFMMPLIQLLLLGYAVNTDVKRIATAVYDFDRSRSSRELTRSFFTGDYFLLGGSDLPLLQVEDGFRQNRLNAALVIPSDFSRRLIRGETAELGFLLDGSNANSAAIAAGYAAVIVGQYNRKFMDRPSPLTIRQKILFNPEAESVNYMVPGIVAVLLTMVTVMLTSMAIVREREVGTLEQLMVTPISTPAFILGKTIPFALLGYIEMSVALAFGILWFGIPFAGSWPLLYGLAFIFLFTTLGVGMFISTISSTQQQAMFFAWFFTIFAILTSGFFSPIDNMPDAIRKLTYLNPLRYFTTIVRGIMMKGSGVDALYREIIAMVVFSSVVFTSAWLRFSKRVK